jgi:sterol desaturase/sphingolipid hydroxylase (fatty acid hydroxylase superfamily)
MAWILALLGILLSFGIKYQARGDQQKDFDLQYWTKDNWFEFVLSFIVMIILMSVFTNPETAIDEEQFKVWMNDNIPFLTWISFPAKLLIPVLVGYLSNEVVYFLVKKKMKTAEKV